MSSNESLEANKTDQAGFGLLTSAEAAQRVRLQPRTLAAMRAANRGPTYVKLGGRCFYRPQDLARWVEAGVCAASSRVEGE